MVYDTVDMKVFLSLLFIIFSLIGIADSGYISYEELSGAAVECGPGFDCGAVLNSQWASIGPVPLAVLGFFFYLTVFILGILNFLEIDIQRILQKNIPSYKKLSPGHIFHSITTTELLLLLTSFGFVFSVYLVSIMAFIIQAWCKFCLISAGTSASLFLVSLVYFMKIEKRSPVIIKHVTFLVINFLYKSVAKPLFFLFDAETMHNSMTYFGNTLGKFKLTQGITSMLFGFSHPANTKKIDGITFPNQIGLAAGFDYNGDLTQILPSVGFGFHTIGTVTYLPYEGNKKPRLGRFIASKGLLVNKGLKSLGATAIAKKLTGVKFHIPTGISIASTNKKFASDQEQILDILKTFTIFEKSYVQHSYYELNISCPNTFGGEPFTSPNRLYTLLVALKKLQLQIKITKPIYIKMPIDQSKKETLAMLKVIDLFPIAGVIFGNLTKDKTNPALTATDAETWKTVKGNVSGKPTWQRSNELIALTRRNFGNRFTIIGTGGVFTGADAVEKIHQGADLLQLITGMIFEGPQTVGEMNLKLSIINK